MSLLSHTIPSRLTPRSGLINCGKFSVFLFFPKRPCKYDLKKITFHKFTIKKFNNISRFVSISTVPQYFLLYITLYFSHSMTKLTKWPVRPAKAQISLGIRTVWSESSLCTLWVDKAPVFLHADSKDSDQTGRMPRLIWIFAGHICHFVSFACDGSFIKLVALPGHIYYCKNPKNLDNSNICCNYPKICGFIIE